MGQVLNVEILVLEEESIGNCTVVIEGNWIQVNLGHEGKIDVVYPIQRVRKILLR